MKILAALLAIALAVCLFFKASSGPVKDAGRDAHADSAKGVGAAADSSLAHTDSVIAGEKRDSSVTIPLDSANAMGRRLDSMDALAATLARVRRANLRLRDSLNNFVMEPDGPADTVFLDTASVVLNRPDSSLSCEARYGQRLEQIRLLSDAIEACQVRRNVLQSALVGVRDTLGLVRRFSSATDSLLAWEVRRPRPCQVDLWIKKVGCGTAMGAAAVISFVGGMVARGR